MLTAVVIVLLLTGRAAPYTFTGGTEGGSFICHCEPDVQCDDDTGACPTDGCGSSGGILWRGTACQLGNVDLVGSIADQTGDGDNEADRCTSDDIGLCCNPRRAHGELSWTVDLGGTFAVLLVFIYDGADDVYRDSIRDVELYLSASRTPTGTELCDEREYSTLSMIIICYYKIGRYLTIRQPDVTVEEMVFCDVTVAGYEYYPCGFYDGDYRWGPACVENCRCEHQCNIIVGICDGGCTAGSRKNQYNRCRLSCDPGFWGSSCESDCHCEQQCDNINGSCDGSCTAGWRKNQNGGACESCDPGFWGVNCHPCRCLDVSEVCDVTTGHCESGCNDSYMGDGCNVVKPSLRESTITFTEDKDVITATITDIEYMTELVSEYLVQYKLLQEDTFISINVHPISGRRRREVGEDDVVLQIPFSNQSINSQYEFQITPLISSPGHDGVIGVPSNITIYNSGCLQYTGLPSCNHWCVCSNDPGTLCLLTCEYCHVCDSEPELPSRENVNFEITDITTNSMRIQFIDAHPDLPLVLVFLTRLGDHHANISSLASNTDYTYDSLGSNTSYDIYITAILEDGVLSKSWTLIATTLTESSDNNDNNNSNNDNDDNNDKNDKNDNNNINDNDENNNNNDKNNINANDDNKVSVVVGSVLSVTGVVALLVVVGILYKRRKAKQSQEETSQDQQPEEPIEFTDENSMHTGTSITGSVYLTPIVTPREGDSWALPAPSNTLQDQQSEERYEYIDESSMRTSTQTSDNVDLTPVVTPSEGDSWALPTPSDALQVQQSEEPNDYLNESSMKTSTQTSDNVDLTPVVTPSEGGLQGSSNI